MNDTITEYLATIAELRAMLKTFDKDFIKARIGNKAASRRLRISLVAFAKKARQFRKLSKELELEIDESLPKPIWILNKEPNDVEKA